MDTQNLQKGNLYLIIAIIVGVIAIGATGFASWKYFGGGSELEKEKSQSSYSPEQEKTIPEVEEQKEIIPSKKNNETANWQIYKNEKYGYEIKYPSNWMIVSDWKFITDATDMGINFCGPEYSSKIECSAGGKGNNPVIKLVNDMLDYKEEGYCVQNKENIFCKENLILSQKYVKIAGRDGIITEFKDMNNGSIHASWKENYTDEKLFSLSVVGLKEYSNYRDVFNQMLSTFKFTEADKTTSIKILSPNGGEKLTVGETYNITWDCPDNAETDVFDIYIQDKRLSDKGIITPIGGSIINCSAEKCSWQIKDISPGKNCFKVQLRHIAGSVPLIDESDNYFSIKSNGTPSVKVLSPNGGEKWKIGSKQTIKWNTQNIPLTDKIAIHIRRIRPPASSYEGQECDPIIFTELKNDGEEDWVISEYSEGNYIIEVVSYKSIPITNTIDDESDTFFQIVK